MKSDPAARARLIPRATPFSDAEQADWDALSETERLALFNEMLNDPADNLPVEDTMEEIRVAARAELAARRG